jgi:hypothetical protein
MGRLASLTFHADAEDAANVKKHNRGADHQKPDTDACHPGIEGTNETPLAAVNDCSGSFEWYASATFHSENQAARVSAATNDR